jgi:hypothetical protein
MMIQLTHKDVQAGEDCVTRARTEFDEKHYTRLPGFLDPKLLEYLMRHVAAAQLVVKSEVDAKAGEFGRTLFVPLNEPAWLILHLFLNQPGLFRLVSEITGCPAPKNFFGRIHRSLPGAVHQIDWHSDADDHRMVGLWINLSGKPWAGGLFQLREKSSQRMILELGGEAGCGSPGDALIFRISPELEHRATPVEAGGPRTVGVGWFRSQPDRETFAKNVFLPFKTATVTSAGG